MLLKRHLPLPPASSPDHHGHHHPGDHRLHAAEEDLQDARAPPPDGAFPAGGAADGGGAASLPPAPCYRYARIPLRIQTTHSEFTIPLILTLQRVVGNSDPGRGLGHLAER